MKPSEITIHNLSDPSRKRLQSKGVKIVLTAGYVGGDGFLQLHADGSPVTASDPRRPHPTGTP